MQVKAIAALLALLITWLICVVPGALVDAAGPPLQRWFDGLPPADQHAFAMYAKMFSIGLPCISLCLGAITAMRRRARSHNANELS